MSLRLDIEDMYSKTDRPSQLSQSKGRPSMDTGIKNESPKLRGNRISSFDLHTTINMAVDSKKIIQKIVITGGPCSGRTTALSACQDLLKDRGYDVIVVPSAIKEIIQNCGGKMNFDSKKNQMKFHVQLIKMQMAYEEAYYTFAHLLDSDKNSIMLLEKGVVDSYAWVDNIIWNAVLEELDINTFQLRDQRYDAVFHLVTAADGAEKFQHEFCRTTIKDPLRIDKRLIEIWSGHQYWNCISNLTENFNDKIQNIYNTLLEFLHEPSIKNQKKKYLLKNMDTESIKNDHEFQNQIYSLHDVFLCDKENSIRRRVIRRCQYNNNSYTLYETLIKENGDEADCRRRIDARLYNTFLGQRCAESNTIFKTRFCFYKKYVVYRVEEIQVGKQQFTQLQVQWNNSHEISLPTFLQNVVIREITDDPIYSQKMIQRKDWKIPKDDLQKINENS